MNLIIIANQQSGPRRRPDPEAFGTERSGCRWRFGKASSDVLLVHRLKPCGNWKY